MNDKKSGLELKVGLFVIIGFFVIASMIIVFGMGGSQGFKRYYPLNVDLPDANGLLKGSDVLLAGARVGYVSTKPVLASNLGTVRVTILILDSIKIPRDSQFKVDSSGLLGDKFVAIKTSGSFDSAHFNPDDSKQAYQPNDVITAEKTPDIFAQAEPVLKKLSADLDSVQVVIDNLKNGALSGSSQEVLKQTFANLKETSEHFAEASRGFPAIVQNAQGVVDKAGGTMDTAKKAADDLQKVLENVKGLVQKASSGDGLIGQLINNRQLAENFNALVVNLREHGVLFYKNSPKSESTPAQTQKTKNAKPQ